MNWLWLPNPTAAVRHGSLQHLSVGLLGFPMPPNLPEADLDRQLINSIGSPHREAISWRKTLLINELIPNPEQLSWLESGRFGVDGTLGGAGGGRESMAKKQSRPPRPQISHLDVGGAIPSW